MKVTGMGWMIPKENNIICSMGRSFYGRNMEDKITFCLITYLLPYSPDTCTYTLTWHLKCNYTNIGYWSWFTVVLYKKPVLNLKVVIMQYLNNIFLRLDYETLLWQTAHHRCLWHIVYLFLQKLLLMNYSYVEKWVNFMFQRQSFFTFIILIIFKLKIRLQ